jgi:hypothetical protein
MVLALALTTTSPIIIIIITAATPTKLVVVDAVPGSPGVANTLLRITPVSATAIIANHKEKDNRDSNSCDICDSSNWRFVTGRRSGSGARL